MKTGITKPVLFMVFNRPEKTQQVWEQIRKAQPKKLYISADGPRETHPDDKEKTKRVRKIVSKVDWDCDCKTLFHEVNQGCNLAGKQAFEWVFSQEESMIELEDDTVPSQSFFRFCDELLEKYKDDKRISTITGSNMIGIQSGEASYFFSRYGNSSGWATWKRVWDEWSFGIDDFKKYKNSKTFRKNFDSNEEFYRMLQSFKSIHAGRGNTYDVQFGFIGYKNNMFSIVPNKNMITNIGFDHEGANTTGANPKFENKERFEINEIVHPLKVERDLKTDKKIYEYHFAFHGFARVKIILYPYLSFLYPFLGSIRKMIRK